MNAFRKMLVRRRGLWNCLLLLAALYLAKGAIELLETTTTKTGQRHHEKKDPLSQEVNTQTVMVLNQYWYR